MKKYQVIGGQYEQRWYGESDSFRGAKVIAGRNKEYWDNRQGWHKPDIYLAEDCRWIVAEGMVTVPDGVRIIVHDVDAVCVTCGQTESEGSAMKQIKGYVGKVLPYGSVWTCRIRDEEAARACLLAEVTGWSAEDAARKFNERLERFGYKITETEKDILRY